MQQIKVLHIITSLGLGGAEKLLLTYLKKLNREKYSFFVCSLTDQPDDLKKEIKELAKVYEMRMKHRYDISIIYKLSKVIRDINPDIIHTHLFQPRIYATMARLFARKGVIISHKHSVVNPKKHNIFIFLEAICILLNKKVIAISNAVKKSIRKYEFIPGSKIVVIPNCVDYNEFKTIVRDRTSFNNNNLIIGTVGRLENTKGINYLLLAMKKILLKYPNSQLEIIGDGSALEELKLLSSKLAISNSVKFFGKLVNPIPNYSRMDIFVLPSILEGFGIVLLEAMAAGIPVIATNVDGIKEVVVDGVSGILVPPKDPDAIAEAVNKLIENPQLTNRLIEQGILRAKLFDVPEHLKKLENLYHSLLGVESCQ